MALKYKDDDNPDILCFLGYCYAYAIGCNVDYTKAIMYFHRVETARPIAKFFLGLFYASGRGFKCDVDKGWTLISEAMESGCEFSETFLEKLDNLLLTNLTEFTDTNLNFRFPGKRYNLKYIRRYLPQNKLGYSLRYIDSSDGRLDLFVYAAPKNHISNNASEMEEWKLQIAEAEVLDAEKAVLEMEKRGIYQNVRDLSQQYRGQMNASRIEYVWYSFNYDQADKQRQSSITLCFLELGQIFKIRYTGNSTNVDIPFIEEGSTKKANLPQLVRNILQELDDEFVRHCEKCKVEKHIPAIVDEIKEDGQ